MMNQIIGLLSTNSFVRILLIAVALDTILGVLRAIKEHKFNSCVGIDGAIRKAAMLVSTCLLLALDVIMHTNVLKNMTLCGLPVPSGVKKWIQKFLEDMTEELPEDAVKKIEATEGE